MGNDAVKEPVAELSSDGSDNGVSEGVKIGTQHYPIHPKTLSEVRDAALKFKEGNPVWAETCNNLARSAELFLSGYGPSEEVHKYSKPEVALL